MNVDFEIFEAGPEVKNTDRVHVTIDKLGHLFLNRHAVAAIGEPDGVTLMYDKRRSIIGVMPSALNQQRSYPLRKKDKRTSRGRCVNAMNFCRKYKIAPSETLAFLSSEVNNNGILVLDLNDVRSVKKVSPVRSDRQPH